MIRLSSKQSKLYSLDQIDPWLVVVCGTIRSGKSIAGIFGYLHYVMKHFNKCDHVVACYSDNVWEGTVLKYAQWWARMTRRTITTNAKGFTVSGRDPELGTVVVNKFYRITGRDISAARRLQGMADVRTVWATEAALFPPELISEFINRLANAPLDTRKLIMDCNPEGGPQHWFKTDWIDRIVDGSLDGEYMYFGPEDNPSMTPEKWQSTCDTLPDGPEKIRKTQGQWVAASGLVFDFAKWKTVGTPPKSKIKYLDVAIDVADSGVTHAVLVGHFATEYWVLDEWRHDGQIAGRMSPAEQLEAMGRQFGSWGRVARWVSDTNGGMLGTLRDFERRDTISGRVFDPHKKVAIGIETTNRMLQRRQLRVSDVCQGLILDAGRYSYNPVGSEKGEDMVIKKDDHGPDAMRYWVMMNIHGTRSGTRPIIVKR